MRRIDADKIKAESRVLCDSCTLRGTEKCTDICVVNLICKRVDLQPTVEATTMPEGDSISREALKRAIEDRIDYIPASDYDEGWNNAINTAIDEIINAPTICDEDPTIPTFNRKELEKARDYWYNHLEVGNEEQNEAAWAAINAIKYCIEHSSGYQEGAT